MNSASFTSVIGYVCPISYMNQVNETIRRSGQIIYHKDAEIRSLQDKLIIYNKRFHEMTLEKKTIELEFQEKILELEKKVIDLEDRITDSDAAMELMRLRSTSENLERGSPMDSDEPKITYRDFMARESPLLRGLSRNDRMIIISKKWKIYKSR